MPTAAYRARFRTYFRSRFVWPGLTSSNTKRSSGILRVIVIHFGVSDRCSSRITTQSGNRLAALPRFRTGVYRRRHVSRCPSDRFQPENISYPLLVAVLHLNHGAGVGAS